jgi:hypothetical protein
VTRSGLRVMDGGEPFADVDLTDTSELVAR